MTTMAVIDCIANSDPSKGPEVPLWECPCRECTQLDWEADEETQRLYGTIKRFRQDRFPEHWGRMVPGQYSSSSFD